MVGALCKTLVLACCPLNSVHALRCRVCITHSYVTTTGNETAEELPGFHVHSGACVMQGARMSFIGFLSMVYILKS